MDAPTYSWPADFAELIADIAKDPGHPTCYAAEVDVTARQLKELALFESATRHRRIRFGRPDGSEVLVGEMNPLVGLGAPADPSRHDAKIRISFHDVAAA